MKPGILFLLIISFLFRNSYSQIRESVHITEKYSRVSKYSNDGALFAVSGQGFVGNGKVFSYSVISIFDAYSRAPLHRVKVSVKDINDFIFTPDGLSIICVGGKSKGKRVKGVDSLYNFHIIDVESGKEIKSFPAHHSMITSITLSNNGKQFLTGSMDKSVKLWDLESFKPLKKIKTKFRVLAISAHPVKNIVAIGGIGKNTFKIYDYVKDSSQNFKGLKIKSRIVRCIEFSPKGDQIAFGGDENKLLLYQFDKMICTDLYAKDKFWFAGKTFASKFSPDGKYLFTGCGNGKLNVFFCPSLTSVYKDKFRGNPISTIAIDPNGSSLLVTLFSKKLTHLYNIKNLNISPSYRFKNTKDKLPPQILITNPPISQSNKVNINRESVEIKGTAVDDYGISNLKINGQNVPLKENGNFVLNLPLANGENAVSVEATDLSDNTSIRRISIIRKDIAEDYNHSQNKNYLLIIGVNDYKHWPKLNNAVKDAQDVAKVLLRNYTFERENATILIDSNVNKNNVIKAMRNLVEKVTPNDNLLIYFSGHGYYDELLNEGYWIPAEANLGSDGEYIPNSTITKLLANINSRHTFLVADACFSGSLFAEASRGYTENVEMVKSRWGLTSGRLEKVSDGQIGTNSPFADSFISFLTENQKDKLSVSELIQHVKVKVAEKSDQTPIGNPIKNVGDEGGEFIFYIKK